MLNINLMNPISVKDAEKLLTADCEKKINDEVFDIYGNYSYPFEEKLSTPNTAVGSVGHKY